MLGLKKKNLYQFVSEIQIVLKVIFIHSKWILVTQEYYRDRQKFSGQPVVSKKPKLIKDLKPIIQK